ncbi:hypothetical protein NE237_010625 [Protea cynaroides]|uniref:Uncharacterized protein n=1 Tax=Protea cynaroides TaxID=273540 RepID=A0A9Q0R1U8_9MAGN|nr:hypothetical protein NE237_010625 [Protea cynaroides]
MDELEGMNLGHYERLPIEIFVAEEADDGIEKRVAAAVRVDVYYSHWRYGEELWRSNGEKSVFNTFSTWRSFKQSEMKLALKNVFQLFLPAAMFLRMLTNPSSPSLSVVDLLLDELQKFFILLHKLWLWMTERVGSFICFQQGGFSFMLRSCADCGNGVVEDGVVEPGFVFLFSSLWYMGPFKV